MNKLVLIRHGQSVYNAQKIFCGWTDVGLTERGIEEARKAGVNLKKEGYKFDLAFTSVLSRAIDTLKLVLEGAGSSDMDINYSWRLNERHYGALQGLKHEEMIAKYGEEQVHIWRRSYSVRPPLLESSDPRNPAKDGKYKDIPSELLPLGESLEDTVNRVLPHWNEVILPQIKAGKKVIIAASGNSLRALIKHIDGISDEEIMKLEIKTGTPLIYELDEEMKPIRHYYLENESK